MSAGLMCRFSFHMKRKSSHVANDSQEAFDLDAFLPYLVNVLARRLSTGFAAIYGEKFGVSIAQWRVLAHLSGHAKVSVREIHERVALGKVSISRAAAGLEAAGYVSKIVNEADRRLVELRLTRKGLALFKAMSRIAIEFDRQALGGLTEMERDAFKRTVKKLIANVSPADVNDTAS